jgi:hypothetical protein
MTERITRWTYYRLPLNMPIVDESAAMDKLGADGWELVTVIPPQRSTDDMGLDVPVAWFKRSY